MRTLIVSDLHLGNGGEYDVFAGGEALPAFLDRQAATPTRVFVNGDGVDFLMNLDPLQLDRARAVEQARAIVAAAPSQAVLRAFGRVLARGGEVVVRLGNHDVELALPEVQAVLREALGQPPAVAGRLAFQVDDEPAILDVGGARILVTHGEHNDPWNQVDHTKLAKVDDYVYAAGSGLVKGIMNPATHEYNLRFVSLLKPDFQGAALTALAVAPAAMKLVFQGATVDILWQLFRKSGMGIGLSFDVEAEPPEDLGFASRIEDAGLPADEQAEIEKMLAGDGEVDANLSYGLVDTVSGASLKLARAGLKLYAGLQRKLAGTEGDAYFSLEPREAEWTDAQRLAQKYQAGAVVIGHTHAARWKQDAGVVFANTGTWIWLMQLPRSDAGDDAWTDFIAELRDNPGLDPAHQKHAKTMSRFTAVLLEPHAEGGAAMSLVEWDGKAARTLGEARVPRA